MPDIPPIVTSPCSNLRNQSARSHKRRRSPYSRLHLIPEVYFHTSMSTLVTSQLTSASHVNATRNQRTNTHKLREGRRIWSCNASAPLAWPFHTICCGSLIAHTSLMCSGNISTLNGLDVTVHQQNTVVYVGIFQRTER